MHDDLVIGAGTAGAILAARLSEDSGRNVILLEAGPDYPDVAVLPETLRDSFVVSGDSHDWGLEVDVCGGRAGFLGRGKVVGGSSQTNGAGALRPPLADFDDWAALGCIGFDRSTVLAAFSRLERDREFGDREYHGASGPIPIERYAGDQLLPIMGGFRDATTARGHAYCEDMNAPGAVGIGPYPQNREGRLRMSTNLAYLAAARARANLTVRGSVRVDRIVFEGTRVVGVEVAGEQIRARRIVVCAGAPYSPALLLRSGIGPARELAELGISVVSDRPGVGKRVIDQPGAVIAAVPKDEAPPYRDPTLQLVARLRQIPGHDVDESFYLCLFARMPVPWLQSILGVSVAHLIMVGDMQMRSRGEVRLTTKDPATNPHVALGFYSAAGDLDRMRAAYRHAWAIANEPAFTAHVSRFALIDDKVVDDDDQLASVLMRSTNSRFNLVGGCNMGPASDPLAVVGDDYDVHGLTGLHVVDASVIPVALRAPAALTCMMLGEHAAVRLQARE